jgi:hypothetical protein
VKTTSNPRAAPKNNPVAASHRQIPRVPASSGTSRPATENVEDAGEEYREGGGKGMKRVRWPLDWPAGLAQLTQEGET